MNEYGKSEIEKYICNFIERQTGLQEVSLQEPFVNIGIGSVESISLVGQLSKLFNVELSPALLWDYYTVSMLSDYLYQLQFQDTKNEAKNENTSSKSGSHQDIAIVGMSCRFPESCGLSEFVVLLETGKSAIREVPEYRHYKSKINVAGFVESADRFDNKFFGISEYEAERIDPQQRMLLEVCEEALADAGIPKNELSGTDTGVFIGISNDNYTAKISSEVNNGIETVIGNSSCIAANRISYLLKINGPSIAIDTACSSSLVAVYQACKSINEDGAEMAIAGGVNVILDENITNAFSKCGMLSPDGLCKTMDDSANGYVRGEGAGVIILKKLEKALEDNDRIYAVIKGGAVNQNGGSNGLTAPNGIAQEKLIKKSLHNAGITGDEIQYVELHGTGTALGDPIEADSLGKALGMERTENCLIGSVKSNIGHLEAAAGIAGLIKTALMIFRHEIYPSIHFNKANSKIDLDRLKLEVNTKNRDWRAGRKIYAAVSSFGFGGTNANLILSEYQKANIMDLGKIIAFPYIVPVSAKTEKGVIERLRQYSETDIELEDLAYTVAARRTHYDYRVAVVASDKASFRQTIKDILDGKSSENVESGVNEGKRKKCCFVFTGQGNQYGDMAKELMGTDKTFRDEFLKYEKIWKAYSDVPLRNILLNSDKFLEDTQFMQPFIFVVQMCLVKLFRVWGIYPDAVTGHSVGEIAALCAAGYISPEQALKILYYRGLYTQELKGKGKMLIVKETESYCENLVKGTNLDIAVINDRKSCILSGVSEEIESIQEQLNNDHVESYTMKGLYAFHSKQANEIKDKFFDSIQDIESFASDVKFYSSEEGKEIEPQAINADYMVKNLVNPVRFYQTIQVMLEDGFDQFLEIGPDTVLTGYMTKTAEESGKKIKVFSSLRKDKQDRFNLLKTLAKFYTNGYEINWREIYAYGRIKTIPTYPWEKRHFWLEEQKRKEECSTTLDEILNNSLKINEPLWMHICKFQITPDLFADYGLVLSEIEGFSFYLGAMIYFVIRSFMGECIHIEHFICNENFKLSDVIGTNLQITLHKKENMEFECSFYLQEKKNQTLLAQANVKKETCDAEFREKPVWKGVEAGTKESIAVTHMGWILEKNESSSSILHFQKVDEGVDFNYSLLLGLIFHTCFGKRAKIKEIQKISVTRTIPDSFFVERNEDGGNIAMYDECGRIFLFIEGIQLSLEEEDTETHVLNFEKRNIVKPRNDMEELVLDIWCELLGREEVSIYDNFFELGANSLLILQFINRINEVFPFNTTIQDIYGKTTVRQLAEYLDCVIMNWAEDK